MRKERVKKYEKLNVTPVGTNCIRSYFEGRTQNSTSNFTHLTSKKGITLIALVITIIIMLILVVVSITVALNGGLFSTAKQAKSDTQGVINAEQTLANGKIKVDGKWYNSINNYLEGKVAPLPSYADAQKDSNGFLEENATLIEGDYTATIPTGFNISGEKGEDHIETGLVIQDVKGNEFVWIPVTKDLENSYSSTSHYSEPTKLDFKYNDKPYDSQDTLDYLYEQNFYNYEKDFNYEAEYEEMVKSVNKYNGFYIGRYETTIDNDGNIGSKENETVLLANAKLKEGTNPNIRGLYYYRWYGLYAEQKKADVTGNGQDVQTAMIYGVLWDETMEFIKKHNNGTYDVNTSHSSWHQSSSVANSGKANADDVALNIWDLESNGNEWTQEALYPTHRVYRGGDYKNDCEASARKTYGSFGPVDSFDISCSRLALYIKN